ncbi:MAG: hypothetical protein N3G20_03990 [Verrucomicrobiae bacterium]|nr:hypothetical protein [Verrucomicrobiae bacterium]
MPGGLALLFPPEPREGMVESWTLHIWRIEDDGRTMDPSVRRFRGRSVTQRQALQTFKRCVLSEGRSGSALDLSVLDKECPPCSGFAVLGGLPMIRIYARVQPN